MFPTPLPPNRPPLTPAAFRALPTGAVRPTGWLLRQLRLQANGLTGHLDEIWPDVGPKSGWLGGPGEAWERGPYYCDGLVPLAYILDDPALIAKASKWMSWTLNSARPTGQFGPANVDWWPRMVMLKALMSYYEAARDTRVLDLMTAYFRYQSRALAARPLENWGRARAADNLLSVFWLYNLTGDAFLVEDLAPALAAQTADWASLQGRYTLEQILPLREYAGMYTHVVNNAQGLKTPAVLYQLTGDSWHARAVQAGIDNLMAHHGQANGIWSGDEHLNGTSPIQGTELCAVAEYLFSLEESIRILGDPSLGDRLEAAAYNAWPATFTPDMWAHQYDQQVNQVLVSVAKRGWANNGDSANIYGLEPNFGCCTANLHQGWPKLARSLFMATPDGGLAAVVYAPCTASVALDSGAQVTLTEATDYPFNGEVRFTLSLNRPVRFPLLLRIPAWAEGASVTVNGERAAETPSPGTFFRLERDWQPGDTVMLNLPMRVRAAALHEGLLSVYRGPLLFALEMGEAFRQVGGELPHADWEVYPTTPWNYALLVDEADPASSFTLAHEGVPGGAPGAQPFATQTAPVRLKASARRLPAWGLVDNSAGPITGGPHESDAPLEDVTLIPYGCTNLRVGAFPRLKS